MDPWRDPGEYAVSLFPSDDKQRKGLPVLKMLTGYFPKAMREITRVCVANNVRYNPGRDPFDINWARGKSKDQFGSMFRHVMEHEVDGKIFEDVPPEVTKVTGIERIYVLAEAAWRINAALELEIEKVESAAAAAAAGGDSIGRKIESYSTPIEQNPPLGMILGAAGDNGVVYGGPAFGSVAEVAALGVSSGPVLGCDCTECRLKRHEAATGV